MAVGLAAVTLRSQTPPHGEWRAWGAGKASTKYAPLDQINTDTINGLNVVWRQSATPVEIGARASMRSPSRNYQNTPLMAGGLIYVSTGIGTIAALDPATGTVVWFDTPPRETSTAASRAVSYWTDGRDARVIGVVGPFLVALNAKTGTRVEGFGHAGEVDLRVGASRPLDGYSWRSAPIIVRDVIVVGSIVTDINNAQMASHMESPPGDVRGYDVRTGKQLWTFHTIPQPGEFGQDLNLPALGNPGRVGPLVTKSFVFMGEGFDTNTGGGPPFGGGKKFRAFDKTTGKVVWETEMEGGTTAPPMTYLWQGKQYIVTAIGWGDHPGELVAFALAGKPASQRIQR